MTIRQQLHNLVWGENHRQENRRWHYAFLTHDQWFAMVAQGALTMPDQSRTWGIDISGRWDGIVDLAVTKERGGDFVFIKGLDGTVRTPLYAENRANAIMSGLLHGPYFWLYPDNKVPARAQAQEGTRFMQEFPSDLPAVIDFEWTRYAGEYANPTYADLDKWATEYLAQGNRKPILYTAAGYTNQFGPFPTALKAKFSALWIANYGVINPTMPNGWGMGWDFWQVSASGDATRYAPNNTGKLEVDLDYWHSDLASLYAFAGTQPEQPPAEEPTMPRYEAIAMGDNTRLRPDHSTANDWIGNYPRGTKFHGDIVWVNPEDTLTQAKGDVWLQVTDVNGQARQGWVAIIHKGFAICTINPPVPPLEPVPGHVVEVFVDGVLKYREELS